MFTPNLTMGSLHSFFLVCARNMKWKKFLILSVCRVFDLFVYTVEAVGESDSQHPHTHTRDLMQLRREDSYIVTQQQKGPFECGGPPANKQMKQSRAWANRRRDLTKPTGPWHQQTRNHNNNNNNNNKWAEINEKVDGETQLSGDGNLICHRANSSFFLFSFQII